MISPFRPPLLPLLGLGLALSLAGPASAQVFGDAPLSLDPVTVGGTPGGYAEGFFVLDNRLVAETDDFRGRYADTSNERGGGATARIDVVPGLVFLTGEYRRTSFKRLVVSDLNTGGPAGNAAIDDDLTTIRGGAGIGARISGVPVYVRGEYSSLKMDGNFRLADGRQNGYGVLAGVSGALNRYFGVEGEAGYQDNKDFGRGFEYRVGGWLNLLPNVALTLHYRRTRLNDHNGNDFKRSYLETGGAGVRFQFGGYGLPLPGPGSTGP